MTTGPMLIFITVTLVEKRDLSRTDWCLIAAFFVCVLCGFLVIPSRSEAVGRFWLALSWATYFPLLYLPCHAKRDLELVDTSKIRSKAEFQFIAKAYAQRYSLSVLLTVMCMAFPLTNTLNQLGLISAPTKLALDMVFSLLTKGLFVAGTMDLHVEILINTERALVEERRINEARRGFM